MRARVTSRVVIVLLIAAITAFAARVATPAPQPQARSAALACGIERWTVKTLQDRPRLLRKRAATIAQLAGLPKPASLPQTRLPFERHIFSVVTAVTLVRQEADQDLHLVLRSGSAQMIGEAPNAPTCTPRATPYRKRQMIAARRGVHLCRRAQVTGVAFFDFLHGQTGRAPNGIELHPILGFSCLEPMP